MMAVKPLLEAMLDKPSRTLRAFDAMPAGAAERQWCITTTIEKQQRLLTLGERLSHRFNKTGGYPFALVRRFAAHIYCRDVGHLDTGVATR